MNYPTPHINCTPNDIAKTVLMPGDPKRSEFIAKKYLSNAILFNDVRGVKGYTGYYGDKRVSVMASGMGMPSMGIYSYELFNFFDVENIIRIGSCGSISGKVNVRDLIFAMGTCTDSSYSEQFNLGGYYSPIASFDLLKSAVDYAEKNKKIYHVGNVLSTDRFYEDSFLTLKWAEMGVLGVEMETAALYMNAAKAGKNALGIFTVSDSLITGESLSSDDREKTFTDMIEVALGTIK